MDRYYVRCNARTCVITPFDFKAKVRKEVSNWLSENKIYSWDIVQYKDKWCFEFKNEKDANWFSIRWE